MNGNVYSHDPYYQSYTVNHRINPNNYSSSTRQPDTNYRHSYSRLTDDNNHLQQRIQPNTVNQRHLYMVNLQQRQRTNLDGYNYRNRGSVSPSSYYDRIHAQYRSNSSVNNTPNPTISPAYFKPSRDTSPIYIDGQTEQNIPIVPVSKPIQPMPQPPVNTFKY